MKGPRALLLVVALMACSSEPAATVATSPSPSPSPSPIVLGAPQYRALWVDAFHDGIKSPAQVEKLVSDAHRANLNALIVQVRKRGDAYFNLGDEPRATDIQGPADFDPLAYVIRLAHAMTPRIEVHAWLNTFFVGGTSAIYKLHSDEWGNRASDGSPGGYLDPGVPEVQIYTHKVFMDVARNYEVDGLHMDFVRYPGVDWGYSPEAIALYKLQTHSTVTPAPDDESFKSWRRARVTSFVRDLHADLKAVKPNVKLSGALICFGGGPAGPTLDEWAGTSAYGSVFQDWRAWMLNGYLDFGVPMNYDSDWSDLEKYWFGRWSDFEKDSGFGNRILTGVGAFLNYPEDTLAQIRRALAPSARGNRVLGIAIYSYGSTSVYGNADFYDNSAMAAGLPRQPYYGNVTKRESAATRGRSFNNSFMTQLARADIYWDIALGWVPTRGVFTRPAEVPALQSRR
ncbi:MAG: hypothetical protein E6J18_11020 [Chloroflexi bacterium]|nr:MAG: hypothetical protein E6J37_03600 [Chloroflexota bacterium]TMC70084.1 MAG: hypothetical protein E6J18_11020 [Chloroflexota bacterium]